MEVVDSVIFSQLILNFEARLKKIFKQLKLLRFLVKRGHRCAKWLWQLGNSVDVTMKVCSIVIFANCWRANKTWSAFTVAGVISLRNFGWLLERFFFCFPEDVLGEQYVTSSWIPVTMSWPSSGPVFSVIWLWKMPASGWGSLWESSSFVRWLVLSAFRDVSRMVLEWPWSSGFIRKSSRRVSTPSMRFSVLLSCCDNFLWPFPQFLPKLEVCSLLAIWEHSSFVPYYS